MSELGGLGPYAVWVCCSIGGIEVQLGPDIVVEAMVKKWGVGG